MERTLHGKIDRKVIRVLRFLVLDQSGILPWLVRHDAPAGVEVQGVSSFEEAERVVRESPPDAAVVSLPPAHLPWRAFQHLCATRRPAIPVLYESCLYGSADEAGIDSGDGDVLFLPKPAPREALAKALLDLAEAALCARGEVVRSRLSDALRQPKPLQD